MTFLGGKSRLLRSSNSVFYIYISVCVCVCVRARSRVRISNLKQLMRFSELENFWSLYTILRSPKSRSNMVGIRALEVRMAFCLKSWSDAGWWILQCVFFLRFNFSSVAVVDQMPAIFEFVHLLVIRYSDVAKEYFSSKCCVKLKKTPFHEIWFFWLYVFKSWR
jgi:hypothetical protein